MASLKVSWLNIRKSFARGSYAPGAAIFQSDWCYTDDDGPENRHPKRPVFDPAKAGWERYGAEDDGFIGLIGPWWMRTKGDSYDYAFLAEPKHHNRRGVVQGGMLMTFADRSMGMTCWYANERQPQATVQLDVHFIDAVQIGEFVECKCHVVRRTRSLVFMSGELVVGDRVVATANGVWKTLGKS